jgi:hypothetical protein
MRLAGAALIAHAHLGTVSDRSLALIGTGCVATKRDTVFDSGTD